jgi:DNA polymerase-4
MPESFKEIRKIIHVDMDAFYASVEQRDNPDLRGKPVAVGFGAKRGVVAAASYEARRFGVHSAMPAVTAMRKCPELVFVRPRFDAYRAVSNQIHEIFSRFTTLIEPLSLDEAYLDVTENLAGIATATEVATQIRAQIRAETALTASAGVSYNKFLAKMASGQRKPDGQFVILPQAGAAFVAGLAVGKFHGIGPATEARMNRLGIMNGADLRGRSLSFLQEHFGKSGPYYYWLSHGVDHRPVRPERVRKSVGSEDTFLNDIRDFEAACDGIKPLVEKVWNHCAKHELQARTITLKVKFSDFQLITRSRTFPQALPTLAALEETTFSLLKALFPLAKEIRLLGVTLSSFETPVEPENPQFDLFSHAS